MSPDAALLLLSVATAFVFISAQSSCKNTVICSCTAEKITVCAEQNTAATDPCSRWPGCKSCEGGSEDPSCSTGATNQTLRSRLKRHVWNGREGRRSHSTNQARSAYQSQGDCSEDIDSPKLGSIRCTSARGRKTCTGTCLPGYTFERRDEETEMVLSCLNGQWTPARAFPPCISGGHCDLQVRGHGRFNCTTGMQGTRCDVFCATQYAGRFNCYPGRPWEPKLPRCVRPKGGESGTAVRCRCEYGASCDRHGRCVCPVGRTGTLCESIVAEKQSCGDPGFLTNGYRRFLDGTDSRRSMTFQDGESLVFGCRSKDYALQGSTFMTCKDGEWSEPMPKCIQPTAAPLVTCPDPGQVRNADRLNTDGSPSLGVQRYRAGQSVAYTCRTGYALQSRSLITCQTSGSWSNSLPSCTPIPAPETLISTSTARPEVRGRLVFCKDPGRVMNGNRVPIAAPDNRGFPPGSSLDYSCNQGYSLQGVGSIFCLVSGRWSSTLPRCEQQMPSGGDGEFCLHPGNIQNGKIIYYPSRNSRSGSKDRLNDPEYPPNSQLVYSCNEGYRLQGASEMTCLGDTGLWSTYPPTCVRVPSPVYCDNPGPLVNGQRVHFPSISSRTGSSQGNTEDPEYPEGARFEYHCDEGYTMKGRSSQICDKGYWSTPKPTCERTPVTHMMYCDNPGHISNGKVQHFPPAITPKSGISISEIDIEYPEGTRLQYSCDEGFVLIGSSSVSCLSTSHWSSDPPICSAECGRSFAGSSVKIFNGNVSKAGEWPWVVSIRENRGSDILCGGAVLNSRTVVTAAHCLTGSDSYILYFGKIRKLDKDDDDKVMIRMSNRIIIHPYYSDQSMDSDIGLIHFSDPIQLTVRVQPICLPDIFSMSKNLRTGSMGFVAGFGENERGVQPNNLMHARLPVQDNEVCVEYYRREGITLNMTQNMFCAGYAGADQATCSGDSGSALVFFDRTMEQFTLEGIVSFATNGQCGVFGRYIVFTTVYSYVPWLHANLA